MYQKQGSTAGTNQNGHHLLPATGDSTRSLPLLIFSLVFIVSALFIGLRKGKWFHFLLAFVVFSSLFFISPVADAEKTSSIKSATSASVPQNQPFTHQPEKINGFDYVGYIPIFNSDKDTAAPVTINYVDENGKHIHDPQTLKGEYGAKYDASTTAYKLKINGYTLDVDKLPNNATGTFSNKSQTVTYIYKKNPVTAAGITVCYVDENGVEIHAAQTLKGNIGEAFDVSTSKYKLIIDGYTLDQDRLPTNTTGTLTDQPQYEQDPVPAGDVTIRYVDGDGNTIHDAKTISGNVGDNYDASTSEYKLAIDGYTLDQTQLPTNATGTLTDQPQTVTYVYEQDPVPAGDVTIRYIDGDGNTIHDAKTISGNVGDNYDASTSEYKLAIDGYTLDQTQLPTNATGTLTDQPQTVTYVYEAEDATITIRFTDVNGNPYQAYDLTTFGDGSLSAEYPNLEQYSYQLDYDQSIHLQNSTIPDITVPTKIGDSYTLPDKVRFYILDPNGNRVEELHYYDENSAGHEIFSLSNGSRVPTNVSGTVTQPNTVITYTLSTDVGFIPEP
ncbi:MucBP domain-containing protein [Listeria grayi]|uniref:MucBP domain-containing protein n=1 Tax=Listeria grayi TaxID=1641 RepID=UPI001111FD7C|nr:MucBP domain-containing protein [Listeria grayi]